MFEQKTKFLVVDDSEFTRKIVRNILKEMGYDQTVEAADGVEALHILKNLSKTEMPINFVISDWNMPNMLGIDLLKVCRKDKDLQKLPFILITVEREQRHILEAGIEGVTEYLVKPFTNDEFKNKIISAYKNIANNKSREAK